MNLLQEFRSNLELEYAKAQVLGENYEAYEKANAAVVEWSKGKVSGMKFALELLDKFIEKKNSEKVT